jgi:hypothetical protein
MEGEKKYARGLDNSGNIVRKYLVAVSDWIREWKSACRLKEEDGDGDIEA